jgi:tetratricopeptide (TPR) repeat protein
MVKSRLFASLLTLQLLVSTPDALAQPKKPDASKIEEAKKLFEEGSIQYKTGDYPKALESFRQVYANTQDPAILFNIGQCQRLLNQPEEALKSFRIFIREAPGNPLVENAKTRITELEAELAKQRALGSIQVMTNPEGAKIFIDGADMGLGPIDIKEVAAGEHTISAKKQGFYPYEFRFELQPGQAFSIRALLREEVTTEKVDRLQPKYFYMVAGGAGVLGTVFGVASLRFFAKAGQEQSAGGVAFLEDIETSRKLGIPTAALFGTSLVAVTSGLFLRLAEKKKATEPCQ